MSLYELLRQCTVRVSVLKKIRHGTGFFVAPGMILTCAHVVEDAQPNEVEVSWQDEPHPAQSIKRQQDYDLALVRVNVSDHPCVYLHDEPMLRDPVASYGYSDIFPRGDTITGECEGWTQDTQPLLKFKMAQVRPGMSGAPLLNERTGSVCGIIKQSRDRESDLGGRAIPTTTVLSVFPELGDLQRQFHHQDPRWMNDIMRESSQRLPPHVFLSYARSDGEGLASDLRMRLQAEGIPLWQDLVSMEGGKDWWLQITEALDAVEFMVLVMTPAAMQSEMVRKEWRYARQQGVCVYPVKGAPDLDFNSMPHWMRSVHFYDLVYEWPKLINDLNTRCQQARVPFMVEDLPVDYVARPLEYEALIDKLLDQRREEPVAITAALRGAGGYGKTTMAKALCHDERIQQAFDDGILWVTLGENPGNLVGKVEDLIYMLNQERPGFTDTFAAGARLAELLADRDILLVVDDVWDGIHLKPFLQGGTRCARLITTRNEDVLPANVQSLVVDAMQPVEAVQLLSFGLQVGAFTATDIQALRALVAQLGNGRCC